MVAFRLLRHAQNDISMKDPADKKTRDLAGDPPRKPGRPAKYDSPAQRQAAFRKRRQEAGTPIKRESVAALRTRISELEARLAAAPDVDVLMDKNFAQSDEIHTLKRTIYEQKVEIAKLKAEPRPKRNSLPKGTRALSYDDRYKAVAQMRWIEWGSHDEIKRLRTNLRKAATAITELNEQLPAGTTKPDAEFLNEVLTALGHYDKALERGIRDAVKVKKTKEAKRDEQERQLIEAAMLEIFGTDASLEAALGWIDALISLDSDDGRAWMNQRNATSNSLVGFIGSVYDLKRVRDRGDASLIRTAVAKERISLRLRGSRSESRYGVYWHAGWQDVIEWKKARDQNGNQ